MSSNPVLARDHLVERPKIIPDTFAVGFAKLQGVIRPAIKDATNPAFRSKYADLGAIWEAVRKPLSDHGFGIIQSPQFEGETMWLETTLLHISGEKMVSRYPLRPVKQDPQGFGSAITYAKRYAISAMLGVVADEDDDGNAASQRSPQASAIHTPMQQDEDVAAGVKNWCDEQKAFLKNCETVADIQEWEELRKDALDRLKRKAVAAWSELMRAKEARIGNINLEPGAKGRTPDFIGSKPKKTKTIIGNQPNGMEGSGGWLAARKRLLGYISTKLATG